MNTELLLKVKEQILREPMQLFMDDWYHRPFDGGIPNCGTAACLAGWVVALHLGKTPEQVRTDNARTISVSRLSDEALGLTEDETESLYYTDNWPDDMGYAYDEARDDKNYTLAAQIAAKRIDHFIATNGEE